ncbi:RimK family alpha-L-glutamate ligase [Belliella marina]|uniref:RimK family alpha-L-glutamate ligase n=1 Tax=Belliella marina TaxID=1644146 RepID=A0ABW4VQ51_9BACT
MKPKIAVITYEARGSYNTQDVADEDELLGNILDQLDIFYRFEVWSDSAVDWSQYDLLLLKSPWDYFDRYKEFKMWCEKISSLNIPLVNSVTTVLWNSDKRYLKEIELAGYSIVKTFFLENGGVKAQLESCFELFDAEQLVIKPTISGGAKNTFKINRDNWEEIGCKLDKLKGDESFMVQPFVDEIVEVGEYSYIFFRGEFSHAVLKSAKNGDYRVQHFYGGKIGNIQPTEMELQYLQSLVDSYAKDTLYARVDGVWRGGDFLLMELELIEPYLFLFTSSVAVQNYKKALEQMICHQFERFGS